MNVEITRRVFLAGAAIAAAGTSMPQRALAALQDEQPASGGIEVATRLPMIELGSSGRTLPRLGLGTFPLGTVGSTEKGVAVLHRAIELGVRYLDTAPSYSRGQSEQRIGVGLQGQDRDEFFINTKTLRRRGIDARRELEQSLGRLKTDYVDSIQIHALRNDVDTLFGDDAVLAALDKAREEGLVRHVGVTAHFNPKYLIEAAKRYDFFSALVPINPLDTKRHSFTREFMPVAREKKIAVIAMKIYGAGPLLETISVADCVHYALSQEGVDIIVPGCKEVSHVDDAYRAAMSFQPLSDEQQAALEERVGPHRGRDSEWYKDPSD